MTEVDSLLFARDGYALAISTVQPGLVAEIKREVENQKLIASRFKSLSISQPNHLDAHVRSHIERIVIKPEIGSTEVYEKIEQVVIDDLVIGGDAIVPSVIRQMDDSRKVYSHMVKFNNHGQSFETYRYRRPLQVVDLLDSILNQIVDDPLDFDLENGGTDIGRRSAIEGWRVYLYYKSNLKSGTPLNP